MSDDIPRNRSKKPGKRKGKKSSGSQLPLIVGIVAVLLVFGGLGAWWFGRKPVVADATQTPAVAEQTDGVSLASTPQMVKFEHPGGVYTCELPGIPVVVPQKDPTIDSRMIEHQEGKVGYLIKYYKVPKSMTAGMNMQQILGVTVTNATKGKQKSDEIFSKYDGHEVVTYKLTTPDGITMVVRSFFHHDAIFEFFITFDGDEVPGERDRFFNSIHLAP